MCEYGSCRVEWDAKGIRGCGSKRYCDEHRPLVRKATAARYYQRNKPAFKERQKNWQSKNLEQFRETQLKYREKNRQSLRDKSLVRYRQTHTMLKVKTSEEKLAIRRRQYAEKKSLLRGTSKDTQ